MLTKSEENTVDFKEILTLVKLYFKDKSNIKSLDEISKDIAVKPFVSIEEKESIAFILLTTMQYSDNDFSSKAGNLLLYKYFYGLVGAYTNIKFEDADVTKENYNLTKPILSKFIRQFCDDDYKEFEELINTSVQLYTVETFSNIVSGVDEETLDKANKELKKNISNLKKSEKLVENIKYVTQFNDPVMRKVIDDMNSVSASKAKKI